MPIDPRAPNWKEEHVRLYLETGGAEGHLLDFSAMGGPADVPCLILKTKGRKSGAPRLAPLTYEKDGANYVVAASKNGAPNHPAWYLNLEADPEVSFQVGDQSFACSARTAEGAEHERLFAMISKVYPQFLDYQKNVTRRIPLVILEPREPIASL